MSGLFEYLQQILPEEKYKALSALLNDARNYKLFAEFLRGAVDAYLNAEHTAHKQVFFTYSKEKGLEIIGDKNLNTKVQGEIKQVKQEINEMRENKKFIEYFGNLNLPVPQQENLDTKIGKF